MEDQTLEEVGFITLLRDAIDPKKPVYDLEIANEVCNKINENNHFINNAVGLLAVKIQSSDEWEAVLSLNLLDTCMSRCGQPFQMEVGKFRFLNEMIKLVSPKYLGNVTSPRVKHQVITLLHSWSSKYHNETKIKEAYDMLKKQGVIKDEPSLARSCCEDPPTPPPRPKNSVFEDEEKSRLLQKLLRSKNPEDLQAANRLIKSMVREDERRVEMNSKRITELESVHNNVKLLSEMLDSYRPGQSSSDELELIKELHQSCERLRPNVFRLASETQDNEAMLNEVLHASDELGGVFDKYTEVIIKGNISQPKQQSHATKVLKDTSLLDLSTPNEEKNPLSDLSNQLSNIALESNASAPEHASTKPQSDIDVLGDIFSSLTPVPPVLQKSEVSILLPVSVQRNKPKDDTKGAESLIEVQEKSSKKKALEDLDALGESLLKQNLPSSYKQGSQFTKAPTKVPMNQLSKAEAAWEMTKPEVGLSSVFPNASTSGEIKQKPVQTFDVDLLVGETKKTDVKMLNSPDLLNGDDAMVDLSVNDSKNNVAPVDESLSNTKVEHEKETSNKTKSEINKSDVTSSPGKQSDKIKPFGDLFVPLESIKPGNTPPRTVLEDKSGISVTLHFAKERPRPDVSVIVVTTISKNTEPIKDYLFQAVVPKTCKLRLQPPSGTELPAHNPFLPPAAITQVMLIANPSLQSIPLKFMVSFTLDDETITEMGEVESLPLPT